MEPVHILRLQIRIDIMKIKTSVTTVGRRVHIKKLASTPISATIACLDDGAVRRQVRDTRASTRDLVR